MNNTERLRLRLLPGAMLWLALLLLGPSSLPAQAAAPPAFQERQFDAGSLRDYRSNPDYQYSRENPKPLDRKKKEENRKRPRYRNTIEPPTAPRGDISGAAKVFFWILIGALVVFLLYQLFQIRFKSLLKKKSDEAVVKPVAEEEVVDIRDMEFENALQEAIHQKRYRHAVRLLYLQSLRQLQDRNLIQWRREKTNRDYLRELQDQRLKPLFDQLTFVFDYVWYGEFPVDLNHFNAARAGFIEFDQALRQRDAK